MNKYTVIIKKTLEAEVTIEAKNEFKAVDKAKEQYQQGKIVIDDNSNLNGVQVEFRTYPDPNDENYFVECMPLIY